MNTICQNEGEYYFLLCRLQVNLFCASGKLAYYTTTVNVFLGKTSFGKTKMVIEDEEISRNLCNYLSQYVFFQRSGPGSYYLGGQIWTR